MILVGLHSVDREIVLLADVEEDLFNFFPIFDKEFLAVLAHKNDVVRQQEFAVIPTCVVVVRPVFPHSLCREPLC